MSDALRVGEARGRWVLLATILGSSMALLDGTVVNLALPRIADDLDASFGGLQWILNGYTLALAALILLGGGLGDRFGRRRIFVMGAVGFTVASLLCAISMNVPMLVGARVLQGVAAAMLTPGSLAIIQASFAPEDRGRAIGLWSGLGGVGTAIGPFLGGWLVDAASWRWIFLLNVPLGIAVVTVAVRHVPETRDPNATGRMDSPAPCSARWPSPDSRSGSARRRGCWRSPAPRCWSRSSSSSGGRGSRSCRWRCSGRACSAGPTS